MKTAALHTARLGGASLAGGAAAHEGFGVKNLLMEDGATMLAELGSVILLEH